MILKPVFACFHSFCCNYLHFAGSYGHLFVLFVHVNTFFEQVLSDTMISKFSKCVNAFTLHNHFLGKKINMIDAHG